MIYFEKAELEAWLRQNPVKTQAQIEQEAQKYPTRAVNQAKEQMIVIATPRLNRIGMIK